MGLRKLPSLLISEAVACCTSKEAGGDAAFGEGQKWNVNPTFDAQIVRWEKREFQ
jgi:hypothetical protein